MSESIDEPRDRVLDAIGVAYDALGSAERRPAIFVAAPYGSLGDALPGARRGTRRGDRPRPRARHGARAHGSRDRGVARVEDPRRRRDRRPQHLARRPRRTPSSGPTRSARCRPTSPSSTSTSLLHVPHDVDDETALDARLVSWLAFADQKVAQVGDPRPRPRRGARRDRGRPRRGIRCARRPRRRARRARARGARPARRPRRPRLHARRVRRSASRRRRRSTCPSCRPPRSARSRRPATSAARARGS